MSDIRFYFSLFIRRLPWFLLIAALVSAVSVIVAVTLPPAYESRTRLLIEAPQIPDELAPSTVRLPGQERLQIIEQRLLTRPNLLDIARRLDVLEDQRSMNPDEIVDAMNARTTIRSSAGTNQATLMQITFEARTARLSAEVLNEYLKLIQQSDLNIRQGRAGQTMDFFEVEVERLNRELQEQGAQLLEFKTANAGQLPESLDFRQGQRATLQERVESSDREIFELRSQRQQLITIFNETRGQGVVPQTPTEQAMAEAQGELEVALLTYSESNPRVKMIQARIANLEKALEAERERNSAQTSNDDATSNPALNLRLAEIDTRIENLERQKRSAETKIVELTRSIEATPAVSIALGELQGQYDNLLAQYNAASDRLAQASTGERIEVLSRGERIAVIEQPAIPSRPTKPNRILIAGGGTFLGIVLGLALVALLEFSNRAPKRPEDIIKKLDIWPLAALPYTRTRSELILQRGRKVVIIMVILVGGPVAVWAVHQYYLPLDLLADRAMDKLGVRW
ncbi:MAG: GumC family protein [Arenibacterium sp.]